MIELLKVVDVCTRVEGNGDIKILIHNDDISNIEFQIGVLRGFNKFLIGKKLNDIPRIVSHICGLCHASQTIASCKEAIIAATTQQFLEDKNWPNSETVIPPKDFQEDE